MGVLPPGLAGVIQRRLTHAADAGVLPDRALDRAYRFREAPPNVSRIPLTMARQFGRARLGLPCGALTVLLNHASSGPQNIWIRARCVHT
jgi:hypothetical protein